MKKTITKNILYALLMITGQSMMAAGVTAFKNPLVVKDGENVAITISAKGGSKDFALPQDTIMPHQSISVEYEYVIDDPKSLKEEQLKIYNFLAYIKDYYSLETFQQCDTLDLRPLKDCENERESDMKVRFLYPGRSGKYFWHVGIEGTSHIIEGNVELHRPQHVTVSANSAADTKAEFCSSSPLAIMSTVRTGYPYEVAEYQGTAHYKVLDPDSVVVCDKDISMNATYDREFLEYIQKDSICVIDSAKVGTYRITLSADFLTAPMSWQIRVSDPLQDASSKYPVDATYRMKDSTFSEKTRNAWNYSGSNSPEYAICESRSAMVVEKTDSHSDGQFSISQNIYSMPQGWYQLQWPGYYRPAYAGKAKHSDPVLASINANSESVLLPHIYDDPIISSNGDYVTMQVPDNAQGAMEAFRNHYNNYVNFYVGTDSLITLGANAQASQLEGALTALGRVRLMFHGKGLAYGDASMITRNTIPTAVDSIYTAGDPIRYKVTLYDGIGSKISENNTIAMIVCKGTEINNDSIILSRTINAKEAGTYTIDVEVPECDMYYDGIYTVYLVSIFDDNEYQLTKQDIITLAGGLTPIPTSVKGVAQDKTSSTYTYDLNGRRVNRLSSQKGIYIQNNKKIVR